ncbi:hypothetical protein EV05_1748 [Prochlorococcus sp. MIT 0601]|nr:hypothetical protein EV05_1748 [Prochlorococcus sp. MIT 0601]
MYASHLDSLLNLVPSIAVNDLLDLLLEENKNQKNKIVPVKPTISSKI